MTTKAYCLFEQSGTFKKQFQILGIQAEDFDLLNDFGETDHIIDLFDEIEKANLDKPSIFDGFHPNDYIIAFFPCIYFSVQHILDYTCTASQWKDKDDLWKIDHNYQDLSDMMGFLHHFGSLIKVAKKRRLRLVIENPYSTQHFLTRYFPIKPQIIIHNRHDYGDYYIKPTQFWFIGFEPSYNIDFEAIASHPLKRIDDENRVSRSMISPDFARWFIKTHILRKEEL